MFVLALQAVITFENDSVFWGLTFGLIFVHICILALAFRMIEGEVS